MDVLIDLLQEWKAFKNEGFPDDLILFGNWLSTRKNQSIDPSINSNNNQSVFKDKENVTGYMMGLLIGYTEHWAKIAFRDLPLKSLTDFGIIMYIFEAGKPAKNEIANHTLAEKSTVFESLKRLRTNGLIDEKTDEHDKRVKRVYLTGEGEKIAIASLKKMINLSTLLEGNLNGEERETLTKLLKKLSSFHNDLYREKNSEEVIKSFNI